MAFMTWSQEQFGVGVTEFDTHHKKLVQLINDLHDGMKAGTGQETLGKILGELTQYTVYHFKAEEALMSRHNYPGYAAQKTAHDQFVNKVEEVARAYKGGRLALSMEVLKFLQEWLSKHIAGEDKKYGPFLNSKGIF